MAWALLFFAIATEVAATSALRYSNGFSSLLPSSLVVVGYVSSFWLLGQALKRHLPLSIAYATWSGVGTAAIAVLGLVVFKESMTLSKLCGIVLIVVGTLLLQLYGAS
jgi:small multidrug resistance pump